MNKHIYIGQTKSLYLYELKNYIWENSKVLLHQVALFFLRFLNCLFFTVYSAVQIPARGTFPISLPIHFLSLKTVLSS